RPAGCARTWGVMQRHCPSNKAPTPSSGWRSMRRNPSPANFCANAAKSRGERHLPATIHSSFFSRISFFPVHGCRCRRHTGYFQQSLFLLGANRRALSYPDSAITRSLRHLVGNNRTPPATVGCAFLQIVRDLFVLEVGCGNGLGRGLVHARSQRSGDEHLRSPSPERIQLGEIALQAIASGSVNKSGPVAVVRKGGGSAGFFSAF
ncbi:MAG: hypothetical protein JWL59_1383, partial [Chthoniobacteraceae bacterium]|nr:hypothetical protein [Chthoniobacteraceae bacterium]